MKEQRVGKFFCSQNENVQDWVCPSIQESLLIGKISPSPSPQHFYLFFKIISHLGLGKNFRFCSRFNRMFLSKLLFYAFFFFFLFLLLPLNLYLPPIFSDMRNLKSCCHVAQVFRFNNLKYQHIGRLSSVIAEFFFLFFYYKENRI